MNIYIYTNIKRKDDTTNGSGAWKPDQNYYWPKNGTLSFDAYAPASAHASTPGAGTGNRRTENGKQRLCNIGLCHEEYFLRIF